MCSLNRDDRDSEVSIMEISCTINTTNAHMNFENPLSIHYLFF